MILVDTGPLVALINARDQDHKRCANAAAALTENSLLTTWPCFTEAMYLLHREGGYTYQDALWKFKNSGILSIHTPLESEVDHIGELMSKYSDTPMDLADASLIALADRVRIKRIFTTDKYFRAYRLADGSVLDMIP